MAGFWIDGAGVNFKVIAKTAGPHRVAFRYAHGGADAQTLLLSVNGKGLGHDRFPATAATWDASFKHWVDRVYTVELKQGQNTICLTNDRKLDGGPIYLDCLTILSAAPAGEK